METQSLYPHHLLFDLAETRQLAEASFAADPKQTPHRYGGWGS